jgi:hypothetical protein
MTVDWYVVCRFTSTGRVEGEYVPVPASIAHAKQMGGTLTACGENAATWARLFHVPFPVIHGENCPVCLDMVGAARAFSRRTDLHRTAGPARGRPRAAGSRDQ